MLNFEDVYGGSTINQQFFIPREIEDAIDDDIDDCLHQPGKKRRLSITQVQFLEKSFEVENKLEPERKVQLAKEIGLQPRQVATKKIGYESASEVSEYFMHINGKK